MMDARTLATRLAAVRIAIGMLATFLPRLGMRLFGFPAEHDTPTTRAMARLFGIRNVVLGVQVAANAQHPDRLAHVARVNAGVDAADVAVFAVPLLRRQGIGRAAVMAGLTATAACVGFVTLSATASGEATGSVPGSGDSSG